MKHPFRHRKRKFAQAKLLILLLFFLAVIAQNQPVLSKFGHNKGVTAQAIEQSYARILTPDTPFYADYAGTIIKFYLPYGYFVKVVQMNPTYTRIIYMDSNPQIPYQEGYVKTCDVFYEECKQEYSPYPDNFSLVLKCDEVLFADYSLNYPKTVLTSSATATYYGSITTDGETFYYVYAGGHVGYVRRSAFLNVDIPPHPQPIEQINEDPTESSGQITPDSSVDSPVYSQLDQTVKIVIVIAVCLVCISVIYLIFKPKNYSPKTAYTGDDDPPF
ncbi:MAG: hypothetical protein IJW13_00880 [Clostridia bacterium]|nr:hypothetical protein [Clostridia bacterium]